MKCGILQTETRLAVASSIGIWFYDTATLQEIDLFTGHTSWVTSIAFSPAGGTLASGAGWQDNTIRLWDVATGEQKRTLTGHGVGLSIAWRLVQMGKCWQVGAEIRPSVCGMSPRVNKSGVSAIPDPGYRALRLAQMEKRWRVDIRPVRCACGMSQRVNRSGQTSISPVIWGIAFSPDGRDVGKCERGPDHPSMGGRDR